MVLQLPAPCLEAHGSAAPCLEAPGSAAPSFKASCLAASLQICYN